jgi:predicted aminopeptidase
MCSIKKRIRLPASLVLISLGAVILSGCSAGFILRSAYEQTKILLKREPIEKVINSAQTDPDIKRKLALVTEAREFARGIGLSPGGSFKTYSNIERDTLVWVVAGSKPTAFELYTWWFPIVGRVPYKGFFDKKSAENEALSLKQKGYETFLRGADALSTLGWFDDPVLTPMLKNDDYQIVNTVIHESVHSTVWIPNHVPFNESMANFVGAQGALEFYSQRNIAADIKGASTRLQIENELADAVNSLYEELDELYKSNRAHPEKMRLREQIFEKNIQDFRKAHPQFKALQSINNAEIMQLKFYLTNLRLFANSYQKAGNWENFIRLIKEVSKEIEQDSKKDPFDLLEIKISKH